jgi:hypothetical protein
VTGGGRSRSGRVASYLFPRRQPPPGTSPDRLFSYHHPDIRKRFAFAVKGRCEELVLTQEEVAEKGVVFVTALGALLASNLIPRGFPFS